MYFYLFQLWHLHKIVLSHMKVCLIISLTSNFWSPSEQVLTFNWRGLVGVYLEKSWHESMNQYRIASWLGFDMRLWRWLHSCDSLCFSLVLWLQGSVKQTTWMILNHYSLGLDVAKPFPLATLHAAVPLARRFKWILLFFKDYIGIIQCQYPIWCFNSICLRRSKTSNYVLKD